MASRIDPVEILDLPIGDRGWELAQAGLVRFCERPIFMVARNEAGALRRTVAIRCKARQAARCVPCSIAYQLDARRLVRLGITDERRSLADVRWWWLTLTAPGIELTGSPVHATRPKRVGSGKTIYLPCAPKPCPACEEPIKCGRRHAPGDPHLGAPHEGHEECFRYWAVVRWNANLPALWDVTMNSIRRELKGRPWTLQHAKVVQWQARGLAHVHCLIRTTARADLVRGAVAGARVQGWGWGQQLKLVGLAAAGAETSPAAAHTIARRIDYLCRYATRDVRVLIPREPGTLAAAHLHRLYEQARHMAVERAVAQPDRIAAGLGYGGHVLTHSRHWGSSFARLASERKAFAASGSGPDSRHDETLEWAVASIGWSPGGAAARLTREMYALEKPVGFSTRGELPPLPQPTPGDPSDELALSWWDQD